MSADPIAPQTLLEAARVSQAWPFEEARKLIARLEKHRTKLD